MVITIIIMLVSLLVGIFVGWFLGFRGAKKYYMIDVVMETARVQTAFINGDITTEEAVDKLEKIGVVHQIPLE